MVKFAAKAILLVSLLSGVAAFAQVTAKQFEIRAKLEKDIADSLHQIISTQLQDDTFTVGVSVQLKESKPPEKPPAKKPDEQNDRPLGLDLGIIDVHGLMESYERELIDAKAKADQKKEETKEPQFQVSSINITVGLDERYPEAYRQEFAGWLSKRISANYGSLAKSEVTTVYKTEAKPSPEPLIEKIRKLQSLLGLALLAAALLVGMLWMGLGLLRVASARKKLSLEQGNEWSVKGNALPEGGKDAEAEENAVLPVQPVETLPSNHDLELQIAKIAFVCMELKEKVNELVRVWLDNGDEGFIKTALLVDAIITAREKILARAGALPALQIPLDPEVVSASEENLAEAFREVADMEIEDRLPKLEQIYWDLISVRTLGLQSLRRPFDFLSGMKSNEIQSVLSTQKTDARALAVMYMDADAKTEFVNSLQEPERETMIAGVLAYSQIPQKTIWDMDTAVKVASMTMAEPNKERVVNLFPRTLEVLQTLNSLDEIKILRRIVPSLPDQGRSLKTQYSTLAFVDSWRPEFIRKLTSVATGDELTTLIRTVPQAKDRILAECPPKVKTIVEDDLRMNSVFEDSITNNRLDALRAKWNTIVAGERISLAKVVEMSSAVEEASSAA